MRRNDTAWVLEQDGYYLGGYGGEGAYIVGTLSHATLLAKKSDAIQFAEACEEPIERSFRPVRVGVIERKVKRAK